MINPPAPFLAFPNSAPHLGLGYLIAYLRREGVEVSYLNCEAMNPADVIIPEGFDFYGLTAVTPQYYFALRINREIKKRGFGKTILGGAHASMIPERCYMDGFDYVVTGYGELALLDIVLGKYNHGIISGRPLLDIDSIPVPAWDDLLMTEYDSSFGKKTAYLFSMRGCPFSCIYCCNPRIYSTKVYVRSVRNVIDEIKYLIESYGFERLYFFDPTFTLNKQRTIDLAEQIRDFSVEWACQTRVDKIDEDILAVLHKSGCRKISFGIEAGDVDVHGGLGKKTTINQNNLAIKLAKDAGLKVKAYLMGALPNENWRTAEKFKEFILKNKPDDWLYSTFTPFPGTPPYTEPERFDIKILCNDFRTYYPLGLNGRGPVNIRNKYLSRDELVLLRDDMLNFLQKEIPNDRVSAAIKLYPQQRQTAAPFYEDLSSDCQI